MSSRIPLTTIAVSLVLLAGVVGGVVLRDTGGKPDQASAQSEARSTPPAAAMRQDHAGSTDGEKAVSAAQTSAGQATDKQVEPKSSSGAGTQTTGFSPPARDTLSDDDFSALVRKGERIFTDTTQYAGQFVGNELQCSNCHLDAGRLPDSAPLWAAWGMYPKYRGKNKHVNDYAERLQGCFRYSMNGQPPPRGGDVLRALAAYSYWLAQGAPAGKKLDGAGYPALDEPEKTPDYSRGKQVFANHCALCHGKDGQGQRAANGAPGFPPLWGKGSYNWGAGMHRVNTAAGFIKANMPLGAATLSDQQAWDVAQFIDSHERPQDPRYQGSVEDTAKLFHGKYSMYGEQVQGKQLGANAPPSGAVNN